MKVFLITFFCATVLVAALMASDEETCLSHNDKADTPNPCEGKTRVRDRYHEFTYCCADSSRTPVGHRTVSTTEGYTYHCSCITHDEYCEEYPLFC